MIYSRAVSFQLQAEGDDEVNVVGLAYEQIRGEKV